MYHSIEIEQKFTKELNYDLVGTISVISLKFEKKKTLF